MSREPTTLLDVIHVIRQLADKLETMAETMTEREVQTFEQVYPPEEGNTEAVQKPVSVKDTPTVSISEIPSGTGRKVTFWFYRFSKGTASETRGIKAVWCFSRRICVLVRGGEAD